MQCYHQKPLNQPQLHGGMSFHGEGVNLHARWRVVDEKLAGWNWSPVKFERPKFYVFFWGGLVRFWDVHNSLCPVLIHADWSLERDVFKDSRFLWLTRLALRSSWWPLALQRAGVSSELCWTRAVGWQVWLGWTSMLSARRATLRGLANSEKLWARVNRCYEEIRRNL